jgi:dipeptidyl aminopeptidase/acylaminoacyl peptidase
VTVPNGLDARFGLATNNLKYQREISWGLEYVDAELVDVETGTSRPLFTRFEGSLGMSPTGRYVWGYDAPNKDLFAIEVNSMQRVALNKDLPHPIWNEAFDNPDYPPLYGFGGWTENDDAVLIYDEFDIWKVDPKGIRRPDRITTGRTSRHSYRITRTDPDQDFVGAEFLATVVNQNTMASGFHRVSLDGRSDKRLVWGDKRFTFVAKAKNADRWAITRQDFVEYPDYWLTNADMANPVKVSDANPQQKDYNWGTAELVSYRSNDGAELKGILIKPEDFDYAKKYPLIAYFYERDSDTLHQYRAPAPSASTINLPMYASNGYLIFIPDIPYKEGYPGESAVSAITAGVNSIVARGYVDPKRLGIQGQSWGGYQVAYLVTETNMFAAACAGAPVSNMVSAYGGIRWGSGLVRQMQYERGQSRIAGSVWDKPLRYIENSPIFFADKVQTPLLMMSNDKDGAVPWYQGIEFFAALRRLEKPVWMAVYNNEDHNLVERKNRKDWSLRMQQFFDHYLKGAPMPKWMKDGIPAVDKGKDYGFELTKRGG